MTARLVELVNELLETLEECPAGIRRESLLLHIATTRRERADKPLDRMFWTAVLEHQNLKLAKVSRDCGAA